jgi:isopenicillin-N epimerase
VEDFAKHWTLEPGLTYLNHGSFGACPKPVLDYQAELRSRMERQPVAFLARELESLLDQSRASLAEFVGAREQDLVFVSNATSGVNTVLRSFDLRAGDEVITTNHTYPACRHALDWVCEQTGARIVVADIPLPLEHPQQIVDTVLAGISPRTRLALLDHITSSTALVFPIERLVRELENRGVPTLVDGAHAPGQVELNLAHLNPAYYTGNCHKWMCAPKGAAFLWAREGLQDALIPLTISHGLNGTREGRSLFHDRFDWTGTNDPTAALCVSKCLEFLGGLLPGGWPQLRERNHRMAVAARELLADALQAEPLCPPDMLGSMASLPLVGARVDGWDPWQRRLLEEHNIEVQITDRPFRILRVSAQLYNNLTQYECLAQALLEVGRQR